MTQCKWEENQGIKNRIGIEQKPYVLCVVTITN